MKRSRKSAKGKMTSREALKLQRALALERIKSMRLKEMTLEVARLLGAKVDPVLKNCVRHELQRGLLSRIKKQDRTAAEQRLFTFLGGLTAFERMVLKINPQLASAEEMSLIYYKAMGILSIAASYRGQLEYRHYWTGQISKFEKKISKLDRILKMREQEIGVPLSLSEIYLEARDVGKGELLALADTANQFIELLRPECKLFLQVGFEEVDKAVAGIFRKRG